MSMASFYRGFFQTAPNLKNRICVFCGKKYSISTGSGVLGKHLKDKHPEFENEPTQNVSTPQTAIQVRNPVLSPQHDSVDLERMNMQLFKWLVGSSISNSDLQNPNLINLLKSANQSVSLWSREEVNDMIIKVYRNIRGDVEATLEEVDSKVSVAIDFWNSFEGLFYMGVSCSWIDKDWLVHRLILDVVRVPYPCSRREIYACMIRVLQMFNIERKVLCFTIDGSVETMYACEAYKEKVDVICYIPCIGKMIGGIIEVGLGCLKPLLSKVREFVAGMSGNQEIMSDFKKYMVMYQEGHLDFPLEVCTDLHGDLTMLEIAQKASKAMDNTIKKHKTWFNIEGLPLTSTDKANINAVRTFMEPFFKVMEYFRSAQQTATVGLYLFFLDHVCELIGSHEGGGSSSSSSSQPEWIKMAYEAMAKTAEAIPTAQLHALPTFVASILDPRIRKSLLPAALDFDAYFEEAKRLFTDTYDAKKVSSSTMSEESEEVSYAEAVARKRRRGDAAGGFDELSRYVLEAPLEMDADVLDWWRANACRYPRLSMMARDYLAIQPTHVPFDELFSNKRSGVLKDKYNLSCDHGEALMCIRSWIASGFSSDDVDFDI